MTLLQGINKKMAVFTGLNFSGGFPHLFLAVLTGITPLLNFLSTCKLSKKYQVPLKLNVNLC